NSPTWILLVSLTLLLLSLKTSSKLPFLFKSTLAKVDLPRPDLPIRRTVLVSPVLSFCWGLYSILNCLIFSSFKFFSAIICLLSLNQAQKKASLSGSKLLPKASTHSWTCWILNPCFCHFPNISSSFINSFFKSNNLFSFCFISFSISSSVWSSTPFSFNFVLHSFSSFINSLISSSERERSELFSMVFIFPIRMSPPNNLLTSSQLLSICLRTTSRMDSSIFWIFSCNSLASSNSFISSSSLVIFSSMITLFLILESWFFSSKAWLFSISPFKLISSILLSSSSFAEIFSDLLLSFSIGSVSLICSVRSTSLITLVFSSFLVSRPNFFFFSSSSFLFLSFSSMYSIISALNPCSLGGL
ncbi:MAG: hypothetical protein MRERV_61c001, partial [Mycoplasmataceae bacterium RV_VA103A]